MLPARRVEIRTYRSHRLEVLDDRRSGWQVVIYAAHGGGRVAQLQDPSAASLDRLLKDARNRIDRVLACAAGI